MKNSIIRREVKTRLGILSDGEYYGYFLRYFSLMQGFGFSPFLPFHSDSSTIIRALIHSETSQDYKLGPGTVAHVCNPSYWETESGCNLRPA
jgi:hypothetical protein